MNERIKEVAEQAKTETNKHFEGPAFNWSDWYKHYNEKFAEMIVKECGAYLMQPEFIGRSDLDWAMVLNEHFGVEE